MRSPLVFPGMLRDPQAWLRSWTLWSLPRGLMAYVLATCLLWLLSVLIAVPASTFELGHVGTFLLLVACGGVVIEVTRRQGEPAGVDAQDVLYAWLLPIAFLLPPLYSLLAPLPLIALSQWRVRHLVAHRRIFTACAIALSLAVSSVLFHAVQSWGTQHDLVSGVTALAWAATAILCGMLTVVLNLFFVAVAVKASSPEATWRAVFWNRQTFVVDWGEQCTGVLLALVCALHPLLAVLALTPVVLLHRGVLHDQLSAAARLDPKTALLNAPTWEREAASEIARALRTKTSLSVMLLDLDHFKQVNDRFGHLAGDNVLRAVAEVLTAQTREYDLCARFGGDEFAVLLPQSDLIEASRTAERIRRHVAALTVPAGAEFIGASVSIGIADLISPDQEVTDLLAAADISLYRAKATRSTAANPRVQPEV